MKKSVQGGYLSFSDLGWCLFEAEGLNSSEAEGRSEDYAYHTKWILEGAGRGGADQ